jgi:hypothetical protein
MASGPLFTATADSVNLGITLTAYSTPGGQSGDIYELSYQENGTGPFYSTTTYLTLNNVTNNSWSGFTGGPNPPNINSLRIRLRDTTTGSPTTTVDIGYIPYIPCIPAGQLIRTSRSDVPVESVKSGDHILTPDGRSVVVKVYKSTALATKQNAPYLIPAHTFRPGYPKKDIQLSPKHKIQCGPDLWLSAEKASKIYPAIKQLVSDSLVHYFHFETPDFLTDDLIVEGSVVESYGPNYCEKYLKGKQPYVWSETHKAEIRIMPGSWRV